MLSLDYAYLGSSWIFNFVMQKRVKFSHEKVLRIKEKHLRFIICMCLYRHVWYRLRYSCSCKRFITNFFYYYIFSLICTLCTMECLEIDGMYGIFLRMHFIIICICHVVWASIKEEGREKTVRNVFFLVRFAKLLISNRFFYFIVLADGRKTV